MKIGFVFDDTLDNPDGVQQYILSLSKEYIQRGHQVHFLVGESRHTRLPNVHSLSKTIRFKFNGNVVGTPLPASRKKIKTLLRRLDLDIIHVQMPYSPFMAGRVISSASQDTAVIGTLHIYPNSKIEMFLNKLLAGINSKTLKKFDDIVAVSEAAKKASFISQKIDVVPNPVQLKSFKKARTNKKHKKLVFLGRLVKRKGAQQLLDAVHSLIQNDNWTEGWSVSIAGKGPELSKLQDFVKLHNMQDIVTFRGFVSEDNKPKLLAESSIASFPSMGGESFGIVLLEGMAAGTVTLGGNNEGYACVMNGDLSKQLVNPLDTASFARLLRKYMNSTTLRNKSVDMQNQHVEAYDVSVVADKLLKRYTKFLKLKGKM